MTPESSATRRLCAGTYLDREFRDLVVRKVLLDPWRRVAPSYGFDLVPVAEHAKRALILDFAQQVCLVAVLVAGWLGSPAAVVTVVAVLALWMVAREAVKSGREVMMLGPEAAKAKFLRRPKVRSESWRLAEHKRTLKLCLTGCVALLLVPLAASAVEHERLLGVLRSAGWLFLIIAGVVVLCDGLRRLEARRMFHAAELRPRRLSRRQQVIDEQQYSGYAVHQRPETVLTSRLGGRAGGRKNDKAFFVGSGPVAHRLPLLTVQLLRPGAGGGTLAELEHVDGPFEPGDLVDWLRGAMEEIGDDWFDPNALPGFGIRDRIYVEETDLGIDPTCLQDPPSPGDLKRIINSRDGVFHHYLEIRSSEAGDLVTTVFLGVTIKGRALCLDSATCALTRLPKKFQLLEVEADRGWTGLCVAAIARLRSLPEEFFRSWRLAAIPPLTVGWLLARKDWTAGPSRRIVSGTDFSLRAEMAVGWNEVSEADQTQILARMKVIELRLLRSAQDFLAARGVDTSALRFGIQMVIRANVLNMGSGKIDIKDSNVGNDNQYSAPDGSGHEGVPS